MAQGDDQSAPPGVDPGLSRPGGISYLHIPATDARRAATFYEKVFGWSVRDHDSDRPSFDDGSGHVSGAWMTDLPIARQPGLLPYIYVTGIDDCVGKVAEFGGQLVSGPDPEGNLWIATFRDPEGNVLGIWHAGPR